jgi:hypothetical protein
MIGIVAFVFSISDQLNECCLFYSDKQNKLLTIVMS